MGRKRAKKREPIRPPLAAVVKPKRLNQPKSEKNVEETARTLSAEHRGRALEIGKWPWLLLLLGIASFYIILKSFSLNPYAGDEFIYIYQAKLVGEGETPYRDFAMAHPPVQAIITALYLKLFGTGLMTLRLLPILWCLAGGVLLAFMVRREYGSIASLFAAFLFLISHEPLRASSHFTGVNMTVTLLIAVVLCYRMARLRAAALLSVLAVFTRLYAIPGVAVLTLYALISNRKDGLRLTRYGAMFGSAAVIVFGFWTGFGDMMHNLLLYHAQKTPMNPASLADMKMKVLFHNATLASLFVLAAATLLHVINKAYIALGDGLPFRKRVRQAIIDSKTGLVLLATLIASTMLIILTNMERVWMYYFIPSFPFAAVAAGWMIDRLIQGGVLWIRNKGLLKGSGLRRTDAILGSAVTVLFAVSFVAAPLLEHNLIYFEDNMDKPPEERVHRYSFKPGPLPEIVNEWVRYLLWHDERIIGEPYNVFNFYLWHESRVLNVLDEVVETIRVETSDGDEIFGDSGTVPLFALISGRRIAGNEVDTNIQRYRSGNADPQALISRIDNNKTKMIILRHRFGVSGVSEVRRLVKAKYRRVKSVRSAQGRVFYLFKRNVAKESSS